VVNQFSLHRFGIYVHFVIEILKQLFIYFATVNLLSAFGMILSFTLSEILMYRNLTKFLDLNYLKIQM